MKIKVVFTSNNDAMRGYGFTMNIRSQGVSTESGLVKGPSTAPVSTAKSLPASTTPPIEEVLYYEKPNDEENIQTDKISTVIPTTFKSETSKVPQMGNNEETDDNNIDLENVYNPRTTISPSTEIIDLDEEIDNEEIDEELAFYQKTTMMPEISTNYNGN